MVQRETHRTSIYAAVVVALLVVVLAATAYSAFAVSSLTGNVDSLQTQNSALASQVSNLSSQVVTLQSQVGNLTSASRGTISVFENFTLNSPNLDPPTYQEGPVYITFSSVMVQMTGGDWIPVPTANGTIDLDGGSTSLLGSVGVPAGNYTAVKLIIAAAMVTLTTNPGMTNQSMTNETLAVSPGESIQAPIPDGAIVYASSVNLLVSFNNHILGGTPTSPTLTLQIFTVSELPE